MRVLTIVHQADSGAGVFADALAASGAEVTTWRPPEEPEPPSEPRALDAILSFGGAVNPDQDAEHPWLASERVFLKQVLADRVPLLGVCLGAELAAIAGGGASRRAASPEIGWYEVQMTGTAASDRLLSVLPQRFAALEWHGYEVLLPAAATELARSEGCLQAYRIGDHAWGIQFHAEVTLDGFRHWLAVAGTSDEAVALEIQPEELADETEERIALWNELGRGICERFLGVAAEMPARRGR